MLVKIKEMLKKILPPPVRSFKREIDRIIEKISTLESRIEKFQCEDREITLWNRDSERQRIALNWGNVTEEPEFEVKFLNLISGLDADSIQIIIKILARQKKYLKQSGAIDLFTREEQEQLRLLKENFTDNIFEVSKHLYVYKNYLLPINHFEPSVFYYKYGLGELKNSSSVKGKAIIDVGAFIGDSALVLSELEPSVIYAFEADPANYELIKDTVALNKLSNVVAENVALSDKNGEILLHTSGANSSSLMRKGWSYSEEIKVATTTLDEYVSVHNIEVGLIKVDIEGSEPLFLAGAKKTIFEQRPILLLSIYHTAYDFFELKPMIESWDLGYKFKIHKPIYDDITSETLLIAEVEEK